MPRAPLVAALALGAIAAGHGQVRTVLPSYTDSSIVNSIYSAAPLSLNSFVSIFGTNLAWETRAAGEKDVSAGYLPVELGGVRVLLDNIPAHLLYVSPGQVNFVVPATLLPKSLQLAVARDGTHGPLVRIAVVDAAPVLFSLDPETVLATHANGSLITADSPAEPGEHIVLYAAGLGQTAPAQSAGKLADRAAEIRRRSELRLVCDGETSLDILYAGVTPGFSGLYQINARLPAALGTAPKLRLWLGERSSEGLRLPATAPTQLSFLPVRLYH